MYLKKILPTLLLAVSIPAYGASIKDTNQVVKRLKRETCTTLKETSICYKQWSNVTLAGEKYDEVFLNYIKSQEGEMLAVSLHKKKGKNLETETIEDGLEGKIDGVVDGLMKVTFTPEDSLKIMVDPTDVSPKKARYSIPGKKHDKLYDLVIAKFLAETS